ncbi:aminoacyl-tRNA hydrolase [Paraphotobacterium marinum]|uniref:Peptidyl-tRNA hydrolase n=1 Tax=Paraphotobacterium marinum TaxID=1755811 RepID=A0A220VCS2_9GAMM|nr:aminoacyl-tRNA hydrolase [Paraphotobacterium marinum]
MKRLKLLVGLANPGPEYKNTRHNVGAWFIESILSEKNSTFKFEKKFQANYSKISVRGHDVHVLVPQTYMNLSGQSVLAIMNFFKIKAEETLVAHDDLDLIPGVAKIKLGGGHGGHNGLKDIMNRINSRDFLRLRIGIGHPGNRNYVSKYVVQPPNLEDLAKINVSIDNSLNIMDHIVEYQITKAQNTLHSQNK